MAVNASDLIVDWFEPYTQNGVAHERNSMWTKGKGTGFPALATCQKRGWVVSAEDPERPGRWRHDLTPAGRDEYIRRGGRAART